MGEDHEQVFRQFRNMGGGVCIVAGGGIEQVDRQHRLAGMQKQVAGVAAGGLFRAAAGGYEDDKADWGFRYAYLAMKAGIGLARCNP